MNNEPGKQNVPHAAVAKGFPPIVLDMGKIKPKRIKQLREGEGPLVEAVEETLERVKKQLEGHMDGKALLPIVMVYRKKEKKKLRAFGL